MNKSRGQPKNRQVDRHIRRQTNEEIYTLIHRYKQIDRLIHSVTELIGSLKERHGRTKTYRQRGKQSNIHRRLGREHEIEGTDGTYN